MKKGKTAIKSATGKKVGAKKGYNYFFWILPFLILVFLFSYFPLHGWIYAFYDYKPPRSLSDCEFVGLQWFKMLFTNKTQVAQLIQVMKNTFAMSLLGLLTSILPLGFAIFLNEIKCKKFKTFVQTFTTLPNFISWVLVYAVAFALFSQIRLSSLTAMHIHICGCFFGIHGKDLDGEQSFIWHPLQELIRSCMRQQRSTVQEDSS